MIVPDSLPHKFLLSIDKYLLLREKKIGYNYMEIFHIRNYCIECLKVDDNIIRLKLYLKNSKFDHVLCGNKIFYFDSENILCDLNNHKYIEFINSPKQENKKALSEKAINQFREKINRKIARLLYLY